MRNIDETDANENWLRSAKTEKNFSAGGGVGGTSVSGFVPFDLPGSADSPANPEPKRKQGKIRRKRKPTMRDFYSNS